MTQAPYFAFSTSSFQRTADYKLCVASFKETSPDGRQTAWVKIYTQVSAYAQREAAILQHLLDFKVNVAKYLHQILGKDKKFYLFMEQCDRLLVEEIKLRKQAERPWTEEELLNSLLALAQTLFQLHAMRLVHRNINPSTIFVQGDSLVLGHFDNAKQVSLGITAIAQSIRGFDNYLTPAAQAALMQGGRADYSYEVSFKDDVWGLGMTLYNMALLQKDNQMATYYTMPQQEFSRFIATSLREKYSESFINLICSMLILDTQQRPSVADLLEALTRRATTCARCEKELRVAAWPCGHIYCSDCFLFWLKHLTISRVKAINCHCGGAIPAGFYRLAFGPLAELCLSPEVKCGKCGTVTPRIHAEGSHLAAYEAQCSCGHLCSLCGAKGMHKILGIRRACPLLRGLEKFL